MESLHYNQCAESSRRHLADGLLEAGRLLVAILVPLWINLWTKQPFEPSKAAIMRTLVWAMMGVWLADGLLTRRSLDDNPLLWQ